jgi:hypothetical protein
MKSESQHLDFLVSQYVDGCLDGANKKSVEQQLLTDPAARKMYDEHREVQDLLDDWGNRIPLINWDEFDQKLAVRLATEEVGSSRYSIFRRWAKPVAAAAALFIAASMGYGWHAIWGGHGTVKQTTSHVVADAPVKSVTIAGMQRATQPSRTEMRLEDVQAQPPARIAEPTGVAVIPPGDAAAKEALMASVAAGMPELSESQQQGRWLAVPAAGSVGVSTVPETQPKPEVIYP